MGKQEERGVEEWEVCTVTGVKGAMRKWIDGRGDGRSSHARSGDDQQGRNLGAGPDLKVAGMCEVDPGGSPWIEGGISEAGRMLQLI